MSERLHHQVLDEIAKASDQLVRLYREWGNQYTQIKAESGSVHNNPSLLQLEDQMAVLEEKIRRRFGVKRRFEVDIPYVANAFQHERRIIADVRERYRPELTKVLQGSITSMYRKEELDQAARELTGHGIAYACVISGPSGVAVVKGNEGDVHRHIREKIWGSGDENSVRPPLASAILFTIKDTDFVVLENESARNHLWPSEFYGKNNNCATAPLLSIDDALVTRLPEVFDKKASIGNSVKGAAGRQAIILTADLKPIVMVDNTMKERVSNRNNRSRLTH